MSTTQLASPTSTLRANFRNLYGDVAWFGILAGSAGAFMAVYAARLGADSIQVGLLSAGPGVVNLLFTLPAGRWLEERNLFSTTFITSILNRLGFFFLIVLPWMLKAPAQIWGIVLLNLVMSIPGTILAISFNAMFAEVVTPEWRAHVVGRRNAVLAISLTVATLISGQILDRLIFPLNYQLVFAIGALGGLMSSYHLSRLRQYAVAPLRVGKPLGDLAGPGSQRFLETLRHFSGLRFLTRSKGRPLLRLDLLRSRFGACMLAYLLFYTFQYIPLPLFPLYYVNELHLTDGAISIGTGIFYTSMTIISLLIQRLTVRMGHKGVLVTGAILFGQYPLILYFAHGALLYWVASVTGGVVWGIVNAGLINLLMDRVPAEDRPAHMALHNLALNIGILVGSLAGPLLGNAIGLREALFVSSFLRAMAGIFLWLWG